MAWAGVHVVGYAIGLARCDSPDARFQLPLHALQIAASAVGVAIAILAELAAFTIWNRTREGGKGVGREGIGENGAPTGRVHFLATIGLTVNPLALAIMVMTGIGAPLLPLCHQS